MKMNVDREWLERMAKAEEECGGNVAAGVPPPRPVVFVIFDDDNDMNRVRPWLVQTSFEKGLLESHIRVAHRVLDRRLPEGFIAKTLTRPEERRLYVND